MYGLGGADTLDEYIRKLERLRKLHGGDTPVISAGGDYPEPATGPYYVSKSKADGYTPEGSIVLN